MEGNIFFVNPKILLSRQTPLEISGIKSKDYANKLKKMDLILINQLKLWK